MKTPATVTLRNAEPADALCLGVLGTQVFLDTYATAGIRPVIAREVQAAFSTDAMQTLIANAGQQVRVAEFDGHLVGFTALRWRAAQPLLDGHDLAELDKLYVQERFTGLGIGGLLLRDAEALAAGSGATLLWLTPWVGNLRALHFYRDHGYHDHGMTLYHIEGEAHENRVLAKDLRAPQALPTPRVQA